MSSSKALQLPHDFFAYPRRPVRILGPIVQTFALAMLGSQAHRFDGCTIASQFVGGHNPLGIALLFEKLMNQPFGGAGIPARLYQKRRKRLRARQRVATSSVHGRWM